MTKLYYTQADFVVLVYDSTNQQTFENSNHWYRIVMAEVDPRVPLLVIANKCDSDGLPRAVEERSGRVFAESNGATFMEVSAKTGDGVEAVFAWIARRYAALHPDIFKRFEAERMSSRSAFDDDSRYKLPDDEPEDTEPKRCCRCCCRCCRCCCVLM